MVCFKIDAHAHQVVKNSVECRNRQKTFECYLEIWLFQLKKKKYDSIHTIRSFVKSLGKFQSSLLCTRSPGKIDSQGSTFETLLLEEVALLSPHMWLQSLLVYNRTEKARWNMDQDTALHSGWAVQKTFFRFCGFPYLETYWSSKKVFFDRKKLVFVEKIQLILGNLKPFVFKMADFTS